jgi:tetratricopeptide (TPR) repeat protein
MQGDSNAFREYAALLLRQHELDPRGDMDSPELDAICEAMDAPWQLMDGRQRRLMRGLAEDLYALADGRHGVAMSAEQRQRWAERGKAALLSGDLNTYLEHLRQPYPQDFPAGVIPFLQANSWVRVGLLEVAVLFYQESGKILRPGKLAAMECLRLLGRSHDAGEAARQLLKDPQSRRGDTLVAASTLFLIARELAADDPKRVFRAIVDPLQRVLEAERQIPSHYRDDPDLERRAARALAFTLLNLDQRGEARAVCNEALATYPADDGLLIARGVATLLDDPEAAESDFAQAVGTGTQQALPYAALAWFRALERKYAEVLSLSFSVLHFPGIPPETLAWLHELRGIALSELRQPRDQVEEEFAKARALDPTSARIEHNYQQAINALQGQAKSIPADWSLLGSEPMIGLLRANLPSPAPREAQVRRGDYSELVAAPAS